MNDAGAVRGRHGHAAVDAQNALGVSGLGVFRVVVGMAAPLDGVRVEVVVRRLDDGQPGDRRKVHQ